MTELRHYRITVAHSNRVTCSQALRKTLEEAKRLGLDVLVTHGQWLGTDVGPIHALTAEAITADVRPVRVLAVCMRDAIGQDAEVMIVATPCEVEVLRR